MSYLGRMIFEDGVAAGEARGMELGMERGRAQGGMQMLISLVKKGILKLTDAAEQANMSEADFEKRMKETT